MSAKHALLLLHLLLVVMMMGELRERTRLLHQCWRHVGIGTGITQAWKISSIRRMELVAVRTHVWIESRRRGQDSCDARERRHEPAVSLGPEAANRRKEVSAWRRELAGM